MICVLVYFEDKSYLKISLMTEKDCNSYESYSMTQVLTFISPTMTPCDHKSDDLSKSDQVFEWIDTVPWRTLFSADDVHPDDKMIFIGLISKLGHGHL